MRIPTVDLDRWRSGARDRAALAEEICDTCHRTGFFVLVNHGVAPELREAMFDTSRRLFALPEAVKATIDKRKSPCFRGWERVGSERTNNRVDHREQVDIWTERPPREARDGPAYLRLHGPWH